jgi:hypothetical protein
MSDFEREDILHLAGEAKMLLDHPMLKRAFEKVDDSAIAKIKSLRFGPEESEVIRDKLMLTLQVVEAVKEELHQYIDEALIMKNNEKEESNNG